jgi:type IV secretion system protein VirB4
MYLKEWRDKAAGFADLLNYAVMIDDGIIQGKDGSLMAAWYYRGPDMQSSSNDELETISARLNSALMRFDKGWMLQIDCTRKPAVGYPKAKEAYFPDRTTLLIDYERQLEYSAEDRNFECLYALTVTYTPPSQAKGKIIDILYSTEEGQELEQGDKTLIWFKKMIRELELTLFYVFNNSVTRMKQVTYKDEYALIHNRDEFLEYLNFCANGKFQRVNLPSIPMYLDCLVGNQDFIGGNQPKIGNMHIRVISIEGLPMESYPGILGNLNYLPVEYRWNSRFIFF